MSKIARKKLFTDESRLWNLEKPAAGAASTMSTKIRSILIGYIWDETHIKAILRITGNSKNLSSLGALEKNLMLKTISGYYHDSPRQNNFYCYRTQQWAVLYAGLGIVPTHILFYENKVERIFIRKFYHDEKDTNFLKFLFYVEDSSQIVHVANFHKLEENCTSTKKPATRIQSTDVDWPFPQIYFKNINLTVRRSSFSSQTYPLH